MPKYCQSWTVSVHRVFRTGHFVLLIFAYALQYQFAVIEQLFRRMRTHVSRDEALVAFRRVIEQPHGDHLFAMCEQLVEWQCGALNNHITTPFSLYANNLWRVGDRPSDFTAVKGRKRWSTVLDDLRFLVRDRTHR